MSRSVIIYGVLLVVSLGFSWQKYTDDSAPPKEGVVVVDGKKEDLKKIVYKAPDLTVNFDIRSDDFGQYSWVTLEEVRKKKSVTGEETVENKTSRFKSGSAGDKLIEAWAPLTAIRRLDNVVDGQLESFGLTAPDSTITLSLGGTTTTFDLGGETYGTKDRYLRDQATGKIYVLSKDAVSSLKFARTKLKDNLLYAAKEEEIASVTLQKDGASVKWVQKNIDDRAAAFWEREGTSGKDETFDNWLEKAMKLKSTDYVQEADQPTGLSGAFDLTFTPVSGKPTTVRLQRSGDDWFAQSEYTRELVKVSKSSVAELDGEVKDTMEGKAPPPKEEKAPPAALTPGGPPGAPPGMGPGPRPPGAPLPPGVSPGGPPKPG